MKKVKKIAICGTRGVPANYGGFETFAEALGSLLVERGYEVIVYCRYYKDSKDVILNFDYKGISCVNIKAPRHKYFETPLHTFKSFLHKTIRSADLILLCNAANSPFAFIPRIMGKPVVINVDGIERERRKWNCLGKAWYLFGELCSAIFGSKLISDADYIAAYYLKKYKRSSTVIRYGSKNLSLKLSEEKINGDFSNIFALYPEMYKSYGIIPGEYILYVSRLEPENNADKVILAYNTLPEELRNKYPLVIVGDAPYAEDFKSKIKSIATRQVIFLGYRFKEEYNALQTGAYLYIQATEVGGTHPALVEAMGFANAILANSVREHYEVVENVSEFYKFNDISELGAKITYLLNTPNRVCELRKLAYERAINEYSWDAVCTEYIELFDSL